MRVSSSAWNLSYIFYSDKQQHWVAAASSRGFVTVFDLRFNLKCRSFSVADEQIKINKIITHPTEPSHIAASIDGNCNCGVWNLESGLRDYALWVSLALKFSSFFISI